MGSDRTVFCHYIFATLKGSHYEIGVYHHVESLDSSTCGLRGVSYSSKVKNPYFNIRFKIIFLLLSNLLLSDVGGYFRGKGKEVAMQIASSGIRSDDDFPK